LRLKAKWFFCALINVHVPTNEKTEEVKEEFYNLLEQNTRGTNKSLANLLPEVVGWNR